MKEITLKVKSCTVIQTHGTDKIYLNIDIPTAFPEMKYETSFQTEARQGYGEEWCKTYLGLVPDIIKSR